MLPIKLLCGLPILLCEVSVNKTLEKSVTWLWSSLRLWYCLILKSTKIKYPYSIFQALAQRFLRYFDSLIRPQINKNDLISVYFLVNKEWCDWFYFVWSLTLLFQEYPIELFSNINIAARLFNAFRVTVVFIFYLMWWLFVFLSNRLSSITKRFATNPQLTIQNLFQSNANKITENPSDESSKPHNS